PIAVINKEASTAPQIIETLEALPEYKDAIKAPDESMLAGENDLVVLVDSHKSSNAEYPELLLKEGNKVILIDHHRREAGFIENTILSYHEPYASSASEMVVEILQYVNNDVELLLEEAKALYAGVMIDTKNFNFKAGARTFEVAAYLRSKGVDTIEIKRMFQVPKEFYAMRAKVIEEAEIFAKKYAIAVVPLDKPDKVFMSQCADELLGIGGVEASFVLC
ncbi:DHH family phosphoesterase, partial [Treponema sp. R6D11]